MPEFNPANLRIGIGKDVHELNAQWYDKHYWTDMHAQVNEIDALINEFNEATGLLKNL